MDLIPLLLKMPADAHVVVGGQVAHGVEIQAGALVIGHYNPQFIPGSGRAKAVVFLVNQELSTGEVVSSPT